MSSLKEQRTILRQFMVATRAETASFKQMKIALQGEHPGDLRVISAQIKRVHEYKEKLKAALKMAPRD